MNVDKSLIGKTVRISDLSDNIRRLWRAAQPVIGGGDFGSEFFVGCSAKVEGREEIVYGFNSEIKGYNDGVHAEEAMISSMRSVHCKEGISTLSPLEAVLVTANHNLPISPCGACRDWLKSYSKDRELPVYLSNTIGEVIPATLKILLPEAEDLLRCERAKELDSKTAGKDPLISSAREQAVKAGIGKKIWGNDVVRYALILSDSHKTYPGFTIPQEAYHGHTALVSAVASFLNDSKSHPAMITSAYLVVAGEEPKLPLGCERQWLYTISSAQRRPIEVTVIPENGKPIRTNSRSLLPYAFFADPVKSHLSDILLGLEQ